MVIRSQVACEKIHEVDRCGARQAVTAFLTSIVVTVLLFGAVIYMARKRPPGTRLTWGEAFIAGAFIFLLFLMIYGVVPDRFLRWADGELKWRTDKIGIPMGPLYGPLHNWLGIGSHGVIAPNGIKFASPFNWASQRLHDWFGLGSGSGFAHNGVGGSGGAKVVVSASTVRDIVATLIYGVGLLAQILAWRWWQGRGKKAERPALEPVSAYGRPLTRGS